MKKVLAAKRAALAVPVAGLVATVGLVGGVALTGTLGGWTTQTINQVDYGSATAMTFGQGLSTSGTSYVDAGAGLTTSSISGVTTTDFADVFPDLAPNETGVQKFIAIKNATAEATYTIEVSDLKVFDDSAAEVTDPTAIAAILGASKLTLTAYDPNAATDRPLTTTISDLDLASIQAAGVISVTADGTNALPFAAGADQMILTAQGATADIPAEYYGYSVSGKLTIKATPTA